jgi:hypothetical protein
MYHQVRLANGKWTGFDNRGPISKVNSCAVGAAGMADNSAQFVAVGSDSLIYHQARFADGTWSEWHQVPDIPIGPGRNFTAKDVAIAGVPDGSAAHLVAVNGYDGNVYHQLRRRDGSWSGWQPLAGYNGENAFSANNVGIAGLPDGSVQVVATRHSDNVVFHQARFADGIWSGWQPLAGYVGNPVFAAGAVSIAGLPDGSSQIAATGLNDHVVYHEARLPNGVWTGWQPLDD